ncbi:sister chromatid cohesion protein DCC1-like isoform X2 [Mizuhopecten yessoensis]|uniref:sister chromatid cohesion protein DCC1-like isoform X2 n=1 Tax=Mizuhopecten yessoensis TaxID=6573 RepID=UPI000B45D750|nr:sister chromatid cohesion protein DCC1-like isoform X2 [Mizuhopecten yessoensis]
MGSLEDIKLVMEYAKIDPTEVKPVVQSVYFSEELDNDAVKFLEVDDAVLTALEAGDELVIRGEKTESAVLCTGSKTYDIKEAEMSNCMLLLSDMVWSKDLPDKGDQAVNYRKVTSVLQNYFELRPCKPKVKKLKMLLEKNMYNGKESEEDEEHMDEKYTFQDLLNLVQASEAEITAALKKLQACKLEGYWRVLHFDFLTQVLNHIIQLSEENDWLRSGLPLEDCCQTLEELFPRPVIEHVISCYADKMSSPTGTEDDDSHMEIDTAFYTLNEDKICRFFAELCLRNAGKFNLQEFLSVWEQSVPSGMKTYLHQVEGMALINRSSKPEVIWYFPAENLPEDVGERFDSLFRTREKWTLDEIAPYVRDLTTAKVDVGGLLLKYARSSLHNGIKVFNSRKLVS